MKNFIWIFILLFSTTLFSFDLATIENKLNPNVEYDILNEDKQIVIKEITLVNREDINKNYTISNLPKESKRFSKFDLNILGNYIKKIYENNDIILKEYIQNDNNSKDILLQISLLDKSNKTEKQIMYKMIFDRNYPSPNNIPLDIFDVKINNDNNILILYLSYGFIYVNLIDCHNETSIIYDYLIPNIPVDTLKIESANFISNNIIKVVRKTYNNTEETDYFKIYQNNNDINKNLIFKENLDDSKTKIKVVRMKLLWSESDLIDNNNRYLSYDYFDQDTEPTIEQLKEKFPNDTFF